MLIIVGALVVFFSMLGGFIIAGGNPMLLLHVSEFVVIGGITLGVVMIAAPMGIIMAIVKDTQKVLGGGGPGAEEYMDLMKLLYEVFMVGRRNGLIALDEHVSDPASSSIFNKYPSFNKDPRKVAFLRNALRPIIDGKIKPDQLQALLNAEIKTMHREAHTPIDILHLVADSLPGIGIVAAVLGIINTMAAIADGPEKVGAKVAAALTGTFLGIFFAYGFVSPLAKRISLVHKAEFTYYETMVSAISGFAKGLAPIMAVEIARRSLESDVQPDADELEKTLKELNASIGG